MNSPLPPRRLPIFRSRGYPLTRLSLLSFHGSSTFLCYLLLGFRSGGTFLLSSPPWIRLMVKTLKGSHFDIRVQPSDTCKTSGTVGSSSTTQGVIEPVVQQLMDMGGGYWGKDANLRALRAAYTTQSVLWNICILVFLLWQTFLFQLVTFLQLKHLGKTQWNQLQFQALRAIVQANPQILQPILQELSKENHQLLRLIQEHHAEFLQLINEPVEGIEG